MQSKEQITEEIFNLFAEFGNADYIGEPVSQLEHAIQAAAMAEAEGYDDEMVLAALFHDIGHLVALKQGKYENMNGFGATAHELIGADYLKEKGFSERLIALVYAHVIAKRYLVSKHEDYYNQLSEASKETLAFQGGKMNDEEMLVFEQHPMFQLYIKMREWDDRAKLQSFKGRGLDYYKKICNSYLESFN
jgi:predicted HD phosphohydrolase